MDDAPASANATPWEGNMLKGATDAKHVDATETDAKTGQVCKNYGLNNNAFRSYSKSSWLGYGKAYLSVPQHLATANIMMAFENADGTTDSITFEEFLHDCDEGNAYDLQGRPAGNSQKGIVVKKGRKSIN